MGFFDELRQAVEFELGRLPEADWARVSRRVRALMGGQFAYIPRLDPSERERIREMVAAGLPERKARRAVRGR